MAEANIVVIGAGVAGLTTALLLSKTSRYNIIVAAKHMPVSTRGTKAAQWDKNTWPPLEDLARNRPNAGIHFQECEIHNRSKDAGSATAAWFSELLSPNPWFKDVVPNFRILDKQTLPKGIDSATSFTSVCINTAIYLPWLVSKCLNNGVVFKRAIFKHISDATSFGIQPPKKIHLVVNCTGLGAAKLGGVEDKSVMPARGQVVVVRNETGKMVDLSGTDDGDDEACYVMTRAAGGGTILGGSYQKGCWDSQVDPNLATRIMNRAVMACPALTEGQGMEKIVRHGVGLRPVREGGARVEKERIQGIWVVHNYGHGGAGYQSSYGCAQEAVELVEEALGCLTKL